MAKKKVVNATEEPQNFSLNLTNTSGDDANEATIAEKLLSLYNLQQICSQIDRIRIVRGELPDEVRDLEDACEGLRTRVANYQESIKNLKVQIGEEDMKIKESKTLIEKYKTQQDNVRNNREYESLTKEIDYQDLEMQLAEKYKIKKQNEIIAQNEEIAVFQEKLQELSDLLKHKRSELKGIIADTEKEEAELVAKAEELQTTVEKRLLTAFERIRKNARNGLAIVQIERDACGGCFSMIPPQRQLDIRLHKKIIVCEACGRIFIDHQLVESQH